MKFTIPFTNIVVTNERVVPMAAVEEAVDVTAAIETNEKIGSRKVDAGRARIVRGQALVTSGKVEKDAGQRKLDAAKALRDARGTIPPSNTPNP